MKKSNPTLYWVHCPICQNKTRTKVREDTVLINFPLYCPVCKNTTLAMLYVWKRSYVNRDAHKQIHTVVLCGLFLRSFGLLEIYWYNSSDSIFLKDFQKIFLSYVTNAIFCNYILWEDKLKYRDISDQDINSILLVRLQRKTSVAEILWTEWRCDRQCRMKLRCNEPLNFIVR